MLTSFLLTLLKLGALSPGAGLPSRGQAGALQPLSGRSRPPSSECMRLRSQLRVVPFPGIYVRPRSSPAKLEAEVLPEHSRKNVGTRVTSVFGLFVLAGVPQLFQIIYVIKLSQILPPFKKLKPESPAW